MKTRNLALLAKLCWQISSSLDMPWAQMLTCKYLTPHRLKGNSRKQAASQIWKACKVGRAIFNNGLRWSIANGESVSAQADLWLPSRSLRQQVVGPLIDGEDKLSAKSLIDSVECISFDLPDRILQEIKGIPISS